jgi:hypothetical protein
MNEKSLIKIIEDYCKENNLKVNDIYNKAYEYAKKYDFNITRISI